MYRGLKFCYLARQFFKMMKSTAMLVARFQVPAIDKNIEKLIEDLMGKYASVAVVLGEGKTGPTRQNPLDSGARAKMLTERYPGLIVRTLVDHPLDDVWSRHLDDLISETFPGDDVHVYGSEDRLAAKYTGRHHIHAMGASQKIADHAVEGDTSFAFRQGAIQTMLKTYPKVYPTVDICAFRNDRKELLLGMKGNEKKWRFPGGFVDPSDQCYEDAARRELEEECGITQVSGLNYEVSLRVDDWRYRYEDDKIMTVLFSTEVISGDPKANDDIEEVRWFSLAEITELVASGAAAKEHTPLFSFILKKYHA